MGGRLDVTPFALTWIETGTAAEKQWGRWLRRASDVMKNEIVLNAFPSWRSEVPGIGRRTLRKCRNNVNRNKHHFVATNSIEWKPSCWSCRSDRIRGLDRYTAGSSEASSIGLRDGGMPSYAPPLLTMQVSLDALPLPMGRSPGKTYPKCLLLRSERYSPPYAGTKHLTTSL